MKTFKFRVAKWFPMEGDESGNLHIDWPSVHRQAGLDQIQWLKSQDITDCQLVVERSQDTAYFYLIAEIYNEKLASLYSLMWAK